MAAFVLRTHDTSCLLVSPSGRLVKCRMETGQNMARTHCSCSNDFIKLMKNGVVC